MTPITIRSAEDLIKTNLLVKHRAGSHAYGTALPTSDLDFRGIFCCDPVNLLTPFYPVRECTDVNEEDTKYYELSHFMKLCLDCNPNIIETLWINDSDILFQTPAYDLLRENRQHLLSSKVAFTFSGYAMAQLKRLRNAKRNVDYGEEFIILMDTLRKGLQDNLLDEEFIKNNCGQPVLEFLINTSEQLRSINGHTENKE